MIGGKALKYGMLFILGGLVVFGGCAERKAEEGSPTPVPTQTGTEAEKEINGTVIPTKEPELTLMDMRVTVGTSGTTYLLPCEEVEKMNRPDCYLVGEKLLVTADPNWEAEETEFVMKLFSLRNGELLAETRFESEGYVTVSVNDGNIAVCDSAAGIVRFLDENLSVYKEYRREADWKNWYVTPDMTALYAVGWSDGICRVELATGEEKTVLDNVTEVLVKGSTGNELMITCDDLKMQQTRSIILNMDDGTISELPYHHRSVAEVYRSGDTWLFHDNDAWGTYYLYRQAADSYEIKSFEALYGGTLQEDGFLRIGGENKWMLYGQDGRFLSVCELAPESGYFCSEPVYSPLWGGYFFTVVHEDGSAGLMFWDSGAVCEGEPLAMEEYSEERPGGETADAVFYQRARELSERYGVDIRIADECQLDYSSYQAEELSEPELLDVALNRLETALASYPEGFFEQLCYGTTERIQIELVDGLRYTGAQPKEGGVAAFARECPTYYLIVADVRVTHVETYYHEFSHVIDKKLSWDACRREDALFSEETWASYSPADFTYAESYLVEDIPEKFRTEEYYAYFVSNYGMSYPTEDRAKLMEEAMSNHRISFSVRPKLIDKMEYYSACIRDCFDTTGWPETTRWEGPYVKQTE